MKVIIQADAKSIPLRENSIDAIVTDPPYGLEFMGKEWDKLSTRNYASIKKGNDSPHARRHSVNFVGSPNPTCHNCGGLRSLNTEGSGGRIKCLCAEPNFPDYRTLALNAMQDWHYVWACEALRILKPGAYLLAFGGTRTYHRLACAIEDAGFEVRDCVMWVYGSGFPKSLDVSKAIDKAAGAVREVGPPSMYAHLAGTRPKDETTKLYGKGTDKLTDDPPATEAAKKWQGFGTALKPAVEPIIVARKPLEGTVAQNVLKWGTGAMNIDGCRIGVDNRKYDLKGGENLNKLSRPTGNDSTDAKGCGAYGIGAKQINVGQKEVVGRWPSNVIHDGSDEVVSLFPNMGISSGGRIGQKAKSKISIHAFGKFEAGDSGFGDSGSAARFFYTAKASHSERGEDNDHPTVKPIALMKYLIKLVTHDNSLILDPFMGSGTTLLAAKQLGRRAIGIEINEHYCEIAAKRIDAIKYMQDHPEKPKKGFFI